MFSYISQISQRYREGKGLGAEERYTQGDRKRLGSNDMVWASWIQLNLKSIDP